MCEPPATTIDLNCDLAEGEPPSHTAALLAHLTSANVACAGHAGSLDAMRRALTIGRALGVRLGAHPGLPGNFGRAPVAALSAPDLHDLLGEQVGRFLELAADEGCVLHHVKLHGTLYHATEDDPALRVAFIDWIGTHAPDAVVYALAGGQTVAAARAAGLAAWDEGFADRAYRPDGTLLPRDQPGAVLADPATVAERVSRLARGTPITAADGSPLLLHVQTVCLHSDSPLSLNLLQAARQALRG